MHLPHLSQPQLTGLVLWVCGAILAGSACQNAVASALSPLGQMEQPAPVSEGVALRRQRPGPSLPDSTGRHALLRAPAPVGPGLVALRHLALAIDPLSRVTRHTAIVISVVYRSCAIPVAWRIHHATQKGSWMDSIVELLRELAPAVPREMTVIVLCDRGISSPKLWKQIRAQGWHPYMRYRNNITFCAPGWQASARARLPSRSDTAWIGQGTAFGPPTTKQPLHPAGRLVRRAGGTLDHPHRPAA